jgi:hypothetical protein
MNPENRWKCFENEGLKNISSGVDEYKVIEYCMRYLPSCMGGDGIKPREIPLAV